MDVVESPVAQVLGKLNAFALFKDLSQCILSFVIEFCNVGMSAFKNLLKCL